MLLFCFERKKNEIDCFLTWWMDEWEFVNECGHLFCEIINLAGIFSPPHSSWVQWSPRSTALFHLRNRQTVEKYFCRKVSLALYLHLTSGLHSFMRKADLQTFNILVSTVPVNTAYCVMHKSPKPLCVPPLCFHTVWRLLSPKLLWWDLRGLRRRFNAEANKCISNTLRNVLVFQLETPTPNGRKKNLIHIGEFCLKDDCVKIAVRM